MSSESPDPGVIRTVAVTLEDLVTAVEITRTGSKQAVLRITPPFSGRMRARLHVEQGRSYNSKPEPVHLTPDQFLDADAPSYPRPAETEELIRADPEMEYTVDSHHERHREAVAEWRASVSGAIREGLTIDETEMTVRIVTLGDPPEQAQNDA